MVDFLLKMSPYRGMGIPHNNQRLIKAARAAFGENWRRPLAKAMGVDKTQVRRWEAGTSEISDDRLTQAIEVCRARVQEENRRAEKMNKDWVKTGAG